MLVDLRDSQYLSDKRSSMCTPNRDIMSSSSPLLSAYCELVKVLSLETKAVESKQTNKKSVANPYLHLHWSLGRQTINT